MLRIAAAAVALLAAGAAGAVERRPTPVPGGNPAAAMAGVYRAVDPARVAPEERGESVLEIVPYGVDEAYVRTRTTWANFHSCSLYGIFHVERSSLVYRGRTLAGEACAFTVEPRADRLVFHDPSGSCLGACGARGKFDGDDRFRITRRRPIRYLDRLLASDEYQAAVAAKEGRIPRPETKLLEQAVRTGPDQGPMNPSP